MSTYLDNDHKFIAVLNKKIEHSKLMNALAHMSVGLPKCSHDSSEMRFLTYQDADNTIHPAISQYPFIILSADNSNQIRTLRNALIQEGIIYNDFTSSMLGASAQDQLDQTRDTKESDLDYFGICMFGPTEKLQPLTKKFSVFR